MGHRIEISENLTIILGNERREVYFYQWSEYSATPSPKSLTHPSRATRKPNPLPPVPSFGQGTAKRSRIFCSQNLLTTP
jgi:hypothetical protein